MLTLGRLLLRTRAMTTMKALSGSHNETMTHQDADLEDSE
jgi:hypothetical protein